MAKVLEIQDLSKVYKNGRGVRNVNISMEEGDVVGLLGPNGSGKTTIMKVIMGLIHADSGKVALFGTDVEENSEAALEKVGGLIEHPALFEYLSAEKNLKMAARYYPELAEERLDLLLKQFHLDNYRKDKAGRFSLGMKQRLGLCLALLSDPRLVVLDEPTNGLDIEGTVEVRDIITALAKEKGTSFLIASHLAAEIEKTCNKVAIIHEGEMLSFTTMEEALRLHPSLEDYFLSTVKETRGTLLI